MRIGYACLAVGVPGTALRTCRQNRADDETLRQIIAHNLAALTNLTAYNEAHDIRLFRISSDIVPFASSPVNALNWTSLFAGQLAMIGEQIRRSGQRVSMHPGQYTVINALNPQVVERAKADLNYHAALLDALGVGAEHKIVLHIGGVYGDKQAALDRFAGQYQQLAPAVRKRLVIENDERLFTVSDALTLSEKIRVPVVFDILHHALNQDPATELKNMTPTDWIEACRPTWRQTDGPQKIHYAQQAAAKRAGAHSDTIRAADFIRDTAGWPDDLDVMLEVKDKNLSAVKCGYCLRQNGNIRLLELEWQRYKYEVLEQDPARYLAIRQLLKNKSTWPVQAFYQLLEEAQLMPITTGHAINAAQHVWGYLKDQATAVESRKFAASIARFDHGDLSAAALKRFLCRVAARQHQPYLDQSLYLARIC